MDRVNFNIDHGKNYNGVIGKMTAVINEHDRRLNALEKHHKEDHDRLLHIELEVDRIGEIMNEHIEFHKQMTRDSITLKHGILLIIFQLTFNALLLYILK